jgi:hypothetical protein
MATIEVIPYKSGGWHYRRAGEAKSETFDDRRSAIDAARAEKRPEDNVVLLRADGSVHGELFHAESDRSRQNVNLEPAGENGEVG